MASNPPNYH
uniref:Secreted salivary peptide n=1 Tax=Triatoma infestans TaxID=30076 RepID=A0A170YJS2_TRIIF